MEAQPHTQPQFYFTYFEELWFFKINYNIVEPNLLLLFIIEILVISKPRLPVVFFHTNNN